MNARSDHDRLRDVKMDFVTKPPLRTDAAPGSNGCFAFTRTDKETLERPSKAKFD